MEWFVAQPCFFGVMIVGGAGACGGFDSLAKKDRDQKLLPWELKRCWAAVENGTTDYTFDSQTWIFPTF